MSVCRSVCLSVSFVYCIETRTLIFLHLRQALWHLSCSWPVSYTWGRPMHSFVRYQTCECDIFGKKNEPNLMPIPRNEDIKRSTFGSGDQRWRSNEDEDKCEAWRRHHSRVSTPYFCYLIIYLADWNPDWLCIGSPVGHTGQTVRVPMPSWVEALRTSTPRRWYNRDLLTAPSVEWWKDCHLATTAMWLQRRKGPTLLSIASIFVVHALLCL